MSKINLLFCSLLKSPWASFATWLHLEAPQENTDEININRLSNIKLLLQKRKGVLGVKLKFGLHGKVASVGLMQWDAEDGRVICGGDGGAMWDGRREFCPSRVQAFFQALSRRCQIKRTRYCTAN